MLREGSLAHRLEHFYANIGKDAKNAGYGDLALKNETLGRFWLKILIFLPFRVIFFQKVRISLILVIILTILAVFGGNFEQKFVLLAVGLLISGRLPATLERLLATRKQKKVAV